MAHDPATCPICIREAQEAGLAIGQPQQPLDAPQLPDNLPYYVYEMGTRYQIAYLAAYNEFGPELAHGTTRVTFAVSEGLILKLPRKNVGWRVNTFEAGEYENPTYTNGWPKPDTVLVTYHGVAALLQERVLEPKEGDVRAASGSDEFSYVRVEEYNGPGTWGVFGDALRDWWDQQQRNTIAKGQPFNFPGGDAYNQVGITLDGRLVTFDYGGGLA